jgi:agmatine/peptidylarginine deiminase
MDKFLFKSFGNSRKMCIVDAVKQIRQMVGIDCRPVIRQHGSLHCCTMQYYP